jgi:hypothetical protein
MNPFDLSLATKRFCQTIEPIADDAMDALDAGRCEHFATGTQSAQAIEASDPGRDTQDIAIEPDARRGIDFRMLSIDRLV